MALVERFLKYVSFDTQSSEETGPHGSFLPVISDKI